MNNTNLEYSGLRNALRITSIASAVALAPSLQAEELAAKGFIEEIIVTAQKRQESLQDTPLAVSAFDASAMEDANIVDIGDIISRTPNFSYTPFSAADPQLFLRGVGSSDDGAGGDPSVVVFFDEVAINDRGEPVWRSTTWNGWKCCAVLKVRSTERTRWVGQ